jgi:hypothetical protein
MQINIDKLLDFPPPKGRVTRSIRVEGATLQNVKGSKFVTFFFEISQFHRNSLRFIFFAKILIKLTTKALGRNFGPFLISFAEAR